jgi:tryptophan synthase beta chain
MSNKRILLSSDDIPTAWYNLRADLPQPMPPVLHPATEQPIVSQDLAHLFPDTLIQQEMSNERWIEIPGEVRDILAIWRPTPLVRARNLERTLKTPARIYFKDESVSPPGSHKPNTAVAQVYYNKKAGISRLTTETGAGQWGTSLSFACKMFGVECKVYMVKVSYEQKPYRRSMMRMWGAEVTASPSRETLSGQQILEADPGSPGSLGIAISEAVEAAAEREDTNYTLGSVLNHVMLHQTVIGLEAQKQMELVGDQPDVVIGCCGGGSNFAGLTFPFLAEKFKGKDIRFVGAEPRSCPTLSSGRYCYDFGDTTRLTPLLKMFTLGHGYIPPGIHAGGLRYHGMAPLVSYCVHRRAVEPVAFHQLECFEAARVFASTEGLIPAPETSHAIRATVQEAIRCREESKEECILFAFSGHGLCDLGAYDRYLAGELQDFAYPQEKIDAAIADLPVIGSAKPVQFEPQ